MATVTVCYFLLQRVPKTEAPPVPVPADESAAAIIATISPLPSVQKVHIHVASKWLQQSEGNISFYRKQLTSPLLLKLTGRVLLNPPALTLFHLLPRYGATNSYGSRLLHSYVVLSIQETIPFLPTLPKVRT